MYKGISILLLLFISLIASAQEFTFVNKVPSEGGGNSFTPQGMAINSNSELFISDASSKSIIKLDSRGNEIQRIKDLSTSNSKIALSQPEHLFIDKQDNLYIYDKGLNKIIVCSSNGTAFSFGEKGSQYGQLDNIIGMVADDQGYVYCLNGSKKRVDIFQPDGVYLTWISGGFDPFKNPVSMSINGKNELCILEADGPSVIMFDVYGNQVNMHRKFNKWEGVSIENPVSIAAYGNGDFLILDAESSRITKFSRAGEVLGVFGSKGADANGSFLNASLLMNSSNSNNNLLVLDAGTRQISILELNFANKNAVPLIKRMRVQERTVSRAPIADLVVNSEGLQYAIPANNHEIVIAYDNTSSTQKFAINGAFKDAVALGVDGSDNIYVVDRQSKEIHVYTQDGVLIRKMGKDIPEKLKSPNSIAIQKNGNVIVSDQSAGNIHMWNAQGIYQKILISSSNSALLSPEKIQVDSKDRLYIWDEKANCIYRTGSNGWPLEMISLQARPERVDENAGKISDFYVDPLDQIFVLNSTTNQIEIYVWDVDPELRFSIGNPGSGPYGLSKIEKIVVDKENFLVYCNSKGGQDQKLLQFLVKPPAPDNAVTYNSADGNLLLVFNKSPSRMVTGYGLVTKGSGGQDSIFTSTSTSILTLDESSISDLKLHHYDFVSLSKSDFSDAAVSFDNYLGYANRLKNAGDYDGALLAYQEAISQFGSFGGMQTYVSSTLSNTAEYLAQNSEAGRAVAYFKAAFEILPSDKEIIRIGKIAYFSYYRELANRGDIADIIADADQIPRRNSYRNIALDAIDSVCFVLGSESNISSLNNSIKLGKTIHNWNTSSTSYTATLARNHYKLFELKQLYGVPALELEALLNSGIKYAEHAVNGLKLNNHSYLDECLVQLKILNASGRNSEAERIAVIELTQSLSKLSEDLIVGYRMQLAEAYSSQLKYSQAALEYERILELDPNNQLAANQLGQVLLSDSRPDEAQAIYRKLLLSDAQNSNYTAQIGRIELLKGNYAEASFQLEKAVSQSPSEKSYYGPLALSYEGASNFRKALVNYQIAVEYQESLLDRSNRRITSFEEKNKLQNELNEYLIRLAEIENELGNFDGAIQAYQRVVETTPNNAAAYFGLGSSNMKAGLVYDAITAFQAASRLEPSNKSYEHEFKMAEGMRNKLSSNETPLSIIDLQLNELFPSLIKNYADASVLPIGKIVVANNSNLPITPTSINVFVKDIMDVPSGVKVPSIVSYSNSTIYLSAIFGEQILKNTEDRNLQLEVVVEYSHAGKKKTISKTEAFVLHGRNAIVWSDKRRLAAFVSPSVQELIDYDKQSDVFFKDAASYGLNPNILQAMQTYSVLHMNNYIYSPDPIQSYAMVSNHPELLDYLQYPAETMKRKSGDCDDLVTLYSSLLENSGVPTAYIDVPGHVLMAFNSGIKADKLESAGFEADKVIISRNMIWIPVETTLLGKHGFITAWRKGAERYYSALKNGQFPELVSMSDARQVYSASNYIPEGFIPEKVAGNKLMDEYNSQLEELLAVMNQSQIKNLESRYQTEPGNTFVKSRYASLLAKIGQSEKAERILLEALSLSPTNSIVLNNLGNIKILASQADEAIAYYQKASEIDKEDAEILINLCKAYLLKGDKSQAISSFEKAVSLDSEIAYLYDELKTQLR